MQGNLRDRGYPSAKEYKPNRSNKNNTVFRVGKDEASLSRLPDMEPTTLRPDTSRKERLIQGLVTAYNNKAFGNPNAPLIQRDRLDYITDDTDERAVFSTASLRNHNGDRLAFANSNVRPDRTGYYIGVDNLPFGENMYEKSFNTPFGTIGAEYDGDGTASLSYESSPNLYYLKALANILLNRGTL